VSDLAEIYASARTAIEAAGSQADWARQIGVTPAYVSDFLNARRDPGPKILEALGYKKRILYVRGSNR
jgi:hypothetical protein